MTSRHSLASRRYSREEKERDRVLPDWMRPAINRWLNAVPASDGGRDMKLIQVLQAYPCKAFIPSRGGISGILKLLERKDPSMRISRKLETLVGRPKLSTLRRTVVRHVIGISRFVLVIIIYISAASVRYVSLRMRRMSRSKRGPYAFHEIARRTKTESWTSGKWPQRNDELSRKLH